MHQIVGRTLAGTGSAERVASGWNEAGRAAADWAAVEAAREFSAEVLKASRAAREELNADLLAIMARSPLGDRPRRVEVQPNECELLLREGIGRCCDAFKRAEEVREAVRVETDFGEVAHRNPKAHGLPVICPMRDATSPASS